MIDKAGVIDKVNIRVSKSKTRFFIFEARLIFAKLRQTFSTALILHYFDLKYHIQSEIHVSGYAINRVL